MFGCRIPCHFLDEQNSWCRNLRVLLASFSRAGVGQKKEKVPIVTEIQTGEEGD